MNREINYGEHVTWGEALRFTGFVFMGCCTAWVVASMLAGICEALAVVA